MNLQLNQMDLIVRDVPAGTEFFRDVLVPTRPAAGTILHFQVEDVAQALEEARSRGATVLLEPIRTGWGTESAMIAGPEEVVIDLYRPVPSEA